MDILWAMLSGCQGRRIKCSSLKLNLVYYTAIQASLLHTAMLICVYLLKLVTTDVKLLSLSSKSDCNYSLHFVSLAAFFLLLKIVLE